MIDQFIRAKEIQLDVGVSNRQVTCCSSICFYTNGTGRTYYYIVMRDPSSIFCDCVSGRGVTFDGSYVYQKSVQYERRYGPDETAR